MLDSFLRQVTKDSYGPIKLLDRTELPAVVLKFHDAFSVMGWGRMPDPLDNTKHNLLVSYPTTVQLCYGNKPNWRLKHNISYLIIKNV